MAAAGSSFGMGEPSSWKGGVTAAVTPTNATGSVTFYNGATPFSTNILVAGVATSGSISGGKCKRFR